MTIVDFEKWLWQNEKVKIFVRAPKSTNIKVENPDAPMFSSANTVRQFKQNRLANMMGDLEYIIFTASLEPASDDMKLIELRKGYREHNII